MGENSLVDTLVNKLRQLFVMARLGRPTHFLVGIIWFRSDGTFFHRWRKLSKSYKWPIRGIRKRQNIHFLCLILFMRTLSNRVRITPKNGCKSISFRIKGTIIHFTAVSTIAKFESKLTLVHWKMLNQVIRYLKGTEDYIILQHNRNDWVQILCWTDIDWPRDLLNRKSRAGILATLNGGLLIWISKLQTLTAR